MEAHQETLPRSRIVLSEVELRELYSVKGFTANQIAVALGVKKYKIYESLKKFGIPTLSKSEAQKKARFLMSDDAKSTSNEKQRARWTEERRRSQASRMKGLSKGATLVVSDNDRERRRSHIISLNKDPEMRRRLADKRCEQWADPNSVYNTKEYWEAYQKGTHQKPNKLEKEFLAYAQQYIPDLVFVGDFSMMVGRKNPDYWVEGTNICIDLFGRYWHEGEDPTDRINYFADFGYTLSVFWSDTWKPEFDNFVKKGIL